MSWLTRRTVVHVLSAIALFHSCETAAQTSQATPPPADKAVPEDQEIVVVAPASERTSIDRTTYLVKDNAEARSSNLLDILGRIPFVDVNAQGEVRLLGTSGVKILVDGKEVAGDLATVLRSLQGSRVAKIEVITNPSAQFSAQGTAGIINIVTRRGFASGFGGSITAKAAGFNNYEASLSPTWSRGAVSLSGAASFFRSDRDFFSQRERLQRNAGGALVLERLEVGQQNSLVEVASGNIQLSYKIDPRQTITLAASTWQPLVRGHSSASIDDAAGHYDRITRNRESSTWNEGSADYEREGPRKGEKLTLSFKANGGSSPGLSTFLAGSAQGQASGFEIRTKNSYSANTAKADYTRPLGGDRSLAIGGSFERSDTRLFVDQQGQASPGGELISSPLELDGRTIERSLYATLQSPALGGTLLGGLRLEGQSHRIAGQPSNYPSDRFHLFPSLHFERKLASWITTGVSYSRRIDWASINDFDTQSRFSDPVTARMGNPMVRSELTDAYEGKFQLVVARQNIDLTLFTRKTVHQRTEVIALNEDGVLISRPVNYGGGLRRGASLSMRGSVLKGLKYSLSADLAGVSYKLGELGDKPFGGTARYGGSLQFDYREGREGRRGADHVTITGRFRGPIETPLYRSAAAYYGEVSWSHAITDRLSAVLQAQDLTGPGRSRWSYFSNNTVSRDRNRYARPMFNIAITRSLGPRPKD